MKLYPGKPVVVRWDVDNHPYPAVLVQRLNEDEWQVRWDPPDPNLPPTYRASEDDIRDR